MKTITISKGIDHTLDWQGRRFQSGEIWSFDGNVVKIVKKGDETSHSLVEIIVPPSAGVPLHLHTREDERVCILSGELQFEISDKHYTVTPGTILFLSQGQPHGYYNSADTCARMLCLFTPGGFENFFELGGARIESPYRAITSPQFVDPIRMESLATKFGILIVGPYMTRRRSFDIPP